MPNPQGINGWEGVGDGPAYGEITAAKRLAAAFPAAGQPVAAGAMNVPKRSQRQAVRGPGRCSGEGRPLAAWLPGGNEPAPLPPDPPTVMRTAPPMTAAQTWAAIAAEPGAAAYPILAEMAARARG